MDLRKSVLALAAVARWCLGCVLCVRLLFWIAPAEAIEARGPSTTCAKVRQISKRSTSLRFYREGIKNRFFLECADKSVFVSNNDCVTEADMKGVEAALAPLSGQYPMCQVTDSSAPTPPAQLIKSP